MSISTHSVFIYRIALQWLSIAVFVGLGELAFSQESFADSLVRVAQTAKADTHKVILLNDIAWEYKFEEPEKARTYLDSALELARRLNYMRGEGTAYNFRGVVEDIHGNSQDAILYFQKALAIRQEIGDIKGVAALYNNIGNVHDNLGEYLNALENYQQSLRLREELGDTNRMVRTYYNISILHENMGNYLEALDYIYLYLAGMEARNNKEAIANAWNVVGNIKTELDRFEEALEAYEKALSLHLELGNEWEASSALNNIANLKDSMAEDLMDEGILGDTTRQLFDEAVNLHKQALTIRESLNDTTGLSDIYNNIGYVLKNVGSYYDDTDEKQLAETTWQEAESYLNRSLQIRVRLGDKAGIMEVYNGLGDVRRRQKRYPEALEYTKKYYTLAKEIEDEKFQQNGLKDLARIYYKLGEYKLAYDYRKDYDELRYDRFNEERIQDEERMTVLYSDNKKQREIDRQKQELLVQDAELKRSRTITYFLVGGAVLLLLFLGVLFNRNKLIRDEKQRSDNLLLNILPAQTAEELKTRGSAKARYHEHVTVLFTDFQSFTSLAEETQPEQLVAELDECFRAFDEIISKYEIEKIKTIGDAYLCAAGLPVSSPTHAQDIVNAALEIQVFLEAFRQKQRKKGRNEFYCRIGIHSGPVVAGVVGKKKFAYDIWGDTVNLAARMEQSGEINKVNISQSTYELVQDAFFCLSRGKVDAKNKGALDMYFVKGIKRVEAGVPTLL